MGQKAIETVKKAMRENGLAFASRENSTTVCEQSNQRIKRRAPKTPPKA